MSGSTFFTTEELAAYCRTSPSTCRYWRAIGYGPKGVRVGRRVLYEVAEVDRWLAQLGATQDRAGA